MKRTFRSIALSVAFLAFGAIVLHSAHLDASHAQNSPTHQCGVCRVLTGDGAPSVSISAPTFVADSSIVVSEPALSAAVVLSGADSRGPPLA